MQVGLGWMNLSPPTFWAMTPREFCACLEGWAELRSGSAPLDEATVEELQRFLAGAEA